MITDEQYKDRIKLKFMLTKQRMLRVRVEKPGLPAREVTLNGTNWHDMTQDLPRNMIMAEARKALHTMAMQIEGASAYGE